MAIDWTVSVGWGIMRGGDGDGGGRCGRCVCASRDGSLAGCSTSAVRNGLTAKDGLAGRRRGWTATVSRGRFDALA